MSLIGQLFCYANYAQIIWLAAFYYLHLWFKLLSEKNYDSFMGHDSPVVDRRTKQYLLNVMAFISVPFPHYEIMLNVLPHYAQKVKLHENNKHFPVLSLRSYEIQSYITKAILSFLH